MWPNDFFLAKKWTMNALSTNASMAYKQPTQKGTTITTQLHTFITHSFSSLDHSTLIYTHTESNIWSGSISAIYIETFSQRFFHHQRIWFEQVKNEWMNKNARETSGSKRLHLKRCKERLRVRDTHTHVHCKARALHIFSPNAFLNGRVHVKIHRQNPHSFKFISMTTKINTQKPKISELTQSTSINTFDFTSTEQWVH